MTHRTLTAALGAVLLLGTSCSSDTSEARPAERPSSSAPGSGGDGHGAVDGAQEVAEPQLHLTTVDATGRVGMLDLLTEETSAVGTVGEPSAVASDGRYVFATTASGVEVVDSGVWTWNHGDHNHYYRAEPRVLGTVPGRGEATVSTGPLSTAGGTGLFLAGSGEAVLLDNEALADGELRETFRVSTRPHDGLVAPFADGAVVTVPDASGTVTDVELVDADGTPVPGTRTSCADASGTITTSVGLVVGCADGALLWTEDGERPAVERVPYPRGSQAPPATGFDARKGRPTVAALAGTDGFWLLDTRERTWRLHEVDVPLLRVSASDDAEGHVVALDRSGRVRVYAAGTGEQLAVTAPLVAGSVRRPRAAARVELVVDQERAYLSSPEEGVVHEIDYADSARVARRLRTDVEPAFLAETGR